MNQDTRNETVTSHHFAENAGKRDTFQPCAPLSTGPTLPSPLQQQVDKFSNPTNRCIHCGGAHVPGSCPVKYHPKTTSSTSKYGSPKQSTEDNNVASVQVRSQVTPQVSPLAQVNTLAQPTHTNSFPPPPYFPIPFPPPPPSHLQMLL